MQLTLRAIWRVGWPSLLGLVVTLLTWFVFIPVYMHLQQDHRLLHDIVSVLQLNIKDGKLVVPGAAPEAK